MTYLQLVFRCCDVCRLILHELNRDVQSLFALVLTGLAVTTSSAQWQSLNGGVDEFVKCFALSADSSSLYVGGSFRYVRQAQDSLGAFGIACWDGAQWDTNGLASPDPISMIGKYRWVGAILDLADTIVTSSVGCLPNWDCNVMQYGTMLVNGEWEPFGEPNYSIDLFRLNDRVFIGGDNTDTIFGQPVNGIGEYQNGSVSALPNSPFLQPLDFYGAAYWHGQYYFAGNTWGELGSPDIVAYDGDSTWSGVGGGMGSGWLRTVAGFGDSLYVGGYFFPGGNNLSTHAQIFDGTAWQPFFSQVEFIGQVWDIQTYEGAIYIWGTYHFQGETTLYGLLRYNGRELCAIGGPMDVGGMAFFQNNLYAPLYSWYPGLENEWVGYLPLDGLVPDTCISISQASVQERERSVLQVYPNPGNDHVSIALRADHYPARVTALDMAGRRVFEQVLTRNEPINTSAWSAGTYELVLHDLRGGVLGRSSWVKLP